MAEQAKRADEIRKAEEEQKANEQLELKKKKAEEQAML